MEKIYHEVIITPSDFVNFLFSVEVIFLQIMLSGRLFHNLFITDVVLFFDGILLTIIKPYSCHYQSKDPTHHPQVASEK